MRKHGRTAAGSQRWRCTACSLTTTAPRAASRARTEQTTQFISALLLVAPLMEKGLELHIEKKIVSKPYIRLSIGMMEKYGIRTEWEGNDIRCRIKRYIGIFHSTYSYTRIRSKNTNCLSLSGEI